MDSLWIIVLLLAAILSLIPVISMYKARSVRKYRCLNFLVYAAFFWTLIIFFERLTTNMSVLYYTHMLTYPLKYILASFMLCTVFNFFEIKLPKVLFYIFGILLAGELFIALSNNSLNLLLSINSGQISGFMDLYDSVRGPAFIYHLILSYAILIISIVFIFLFLSKHKNERYYRSITQTMIFSVFTVLILNLLQLLVFDVEVDLTYVSLIIASFTMYNTIYKKDMTFNLKASGRGEILANMREIYILTDSEKRVIDVSNLLISKYQILWEDFIGKSLDLLLAELSKYIIFFSEYEVDTVENPNKDHYHMREKQFSLKGINDYGYMILLYDETQVFKLLRELNKLSNYDSMTGLNNRNFIEHKLEEIKTISDVGVISLDLNGLKVNNDYLGHERGDYLLKSLANNIKKVMSQYKDANIGRIGGDEFLIIVRKTTEKIIKDIKKEILSLCHNEDIEKTISVSIGVAFSKDEVNIYKLIQEADKDMYNMKQQTSKDYSMKIVEYAKKTERYIR